MVLGFHPIVSQISTKFQESNCVIALCFWSDYYVMSAALSDENNLKGQPNDSICTMWSAALRCVWSRSKSEVTKGCCPGLIIQKVFYVCFFLKPAVGKGASSGQYSSLTTTTAAVCVCVRLSYHCVLVCMCSAQVFVCLWKGCKVYNTPSTSQSWLQRHMLTHSGDKPFKVTTHPSH